MSMLDEMFESEQLNERPYSRSQEGADKLKGKVKSYFGSGQVEQGAADSGRLANRLWNEFKRAIGRKYGQSQSSVPYSDVYAFFKANDLDTSVLGNNTKIPFAPKDVGQALLNAARLYAGSLGNKETEEEIASQQPQKQQKEQPKEKPEVEEPKEISSAEKQEALGPLKGQLSALSNEDREKLLRILM